MSKFVARCVSISCFLILAMLHQLATAQDIATLEAVDLALEKSQFEQALQLCQTGAEANPKEVGYWRGMARALRELDRVNDIPAAISPGIKKLPRESLLLLLRAIAYKNTQQYDKMIADATLMTTIGDPRGFQLLARVAEDKDECIKSIQLHSRLMECYPQSEEMPAWQATRAQRFTEIHIFDWALSDIEASIKAEPTALKVLLHGEILARCQRWEEAEEALTRFNSMTDKHFVGEVRRLSTLLAMHEYDKLEYFLTQYKEKYSATDKLNHVADIEKALQTRRALEAKIVAEAKAQQHPHGFETSEEITAGRERMQKLAKATSAAELEELKTLLIQHAQFGMSQTNPQYADVMLKTLNNKRAKFKMTARDLANEFTVRAWLLMQADQYEEASKTVQQAIGHDAKCGDAHRVAGSIYYMMDDVDKALEALNASLKINPLDSIALGFRGSIFTALGRSEQAAPDLSKASELDPLNPWIMSLLETFTTKMGSEKLAIKYHCLPHNGDYSSTILERSDLIMNSLPQLALQDVGEYAAAAGEAGEEFNKAGASLIMAKTAHAWLLQTMAFETGGPTFKEVIAICRAAIKHNPENEVVQMLLSDTLRRDGQLKESLEVAEKALAGGATYSFLMQHIVGLQLAVGDVPAAIEANKLLQRYSFPDETGEQIQKETAEMMALAADLDRTLKQMDFVGKTGEAMEQLLGKSEDTAKAFVGSTAEELASLYEKLRPQATKVSLKADQNQLHYEYTTTAKLRKQNPNAFEFDSELAAMANDLKDGQHWFTVRCKNPETDSGQSFAYFVKLDNGWKIFPQP